MKMTAAQAEVVNAIKNGYTLELRHYPAIGKHGVASNLVHLTKPNGFRRRIGKSTFNALVNLGVIVALTVQECGTTESDGQKVTNISTTFGLKS